MDWRFWQHRLGRRDWRHRSYFGNGRHRLDGPNRFERWNPWLRLTAVQVELPNRVP